MILSQTVPLPTLRSFEPAALFAGDVSQQDTESMRSDNERPENRKPRNGQPGNAPPGNERPGNETAASRRPDPLVRSFIDYLKVEKGLAPLSVSAYQADLVQFMEFLQSRKRALAQARREDVRGFLSQLFSNGVRDRSVARKL